MSYFKALVVPKGKHLYLQLYASDVPELIENILHVRSIFLSGEKNKVVAVSLVIAYNAGDWK